MNSQALSRWVRNKSDELAVSQGCYFDIHAADRVRYFFARFLRHSKGEWAGKPFELLDWQWERCIAPLFGWKMPDGTRRFKRAGWGLPKKNGKSTLLSGISIYTLCGDGEPGAEVYSAAADRDQASIIYNEAAAMVEASPALASWIEVVRSSKRMRFAKTNSIYKALSADVPTKEGLNIHCLLFDELHAQKTWDLWNTLRYGGAARRQPLLIWISTAGADKNSLCAAQWKYALDIQESRAVDIRFLPFIAAADPDDDWTQPETWKKANPSYGITIKQEDMQADCTEAQNRPVEENNFKRYRLNLWTSQITRWISMARWDACRDEYTEADLRGQVCRVGLDLASTSDLAAMVCLFKQGSGYRILPYFWLPRNRLRTREQENLTRLDQWAHDGFIKLTEGDVIDYDVIRADINALPFDVQEIAIDPWNATQIATDLIGDGFAVQYVRTGFISISAATKEYEKLVLAGQMRHPDNPVYNWMMNNVAVETDASGNLKPSKRRSSEKIDGVVATILALARSISAVTKKPSKYDKGEGLACV